MEIRTNSWNSIYKYSTGVQNTNRTSSKWKSLCIGYNNPSETPVIQEFEVVATGQLFESESRKYINTVQIAWTVWHVFEVI